MNYLSDYITKQNLKEWIRGQEDILLVANAGSGKTYLLLEEFVTEAKKEGLKVLYCYNRKSMCTQFAESYATKHFNLTITSYQALEKQVLFSNSDHYLQEYDIILCDECHYFVSDSFTNTTYISFEKIQRNNAMKIYFTATPDPFIELQYLMKEYKTLDLRSLTQQNVDEIELVQATSLFDSAEKHYLKENTIIHFENHKDHNKILALTYKLEGYKTIDLDADSNNEVTQQITSTNQQRNVFVDFLATTSTNENGVNLNIEKNSIVTFRKNADFTSIVQSAARLRRFEGNQNNTIKMLINMPHKNLLIKGIKNNEKELETLYAQRNKILLVREFIVSIIQFDFKITKLELELETFNEMLKFKDLKEYYAMKLAELYPNASIKTLDKYDLLPIEATLNNLLMNENEIIIDSEMQMLLKEEIGCGMNVINRKMKGKYEISTVRKTKSKQKDLYWIIKRFNYI